MSAEKAPVSVVVITKDEERNLEDCLKSVQWAKEIVIVDDKSTDRTVEIARKYTDKIFTRTMDREGKHRNFAYGKATQPWVLSLDADERITEELGREITKVTQNNAEGHVCYSMPMKTYLGDEWLFAAGYYPARKSKLFQKDKYRYDETATVHPRVFYEGSCGKLNGDLIHYSFDDVEHLLRKFNRETSLEAGKWVTDGRKVRTANIVRKSIDRFLKNYLIKKGWKMGFNGYVMSAFHGFYQLITYAKYRDLVKKGKKSPAKKTAEEKTDRLEVQHQ